MAHLTEEQILDGLRRAYRTLPDLSKLEDPDEDTMVWISDTKAIVAKSGGSISVEIKTIQLTSQPDKGYRSLKQTLIDEISKLRLQTGGVTVAVEKGNVFDYFEETRKIIQTAKTDIFLVDSYVDADIVSNYFKSVNPSIKVRILTSAKQGVLASIVPAAQMLQQQTGATIEIRSNQFHDRFWLIDGSYGFQSSSSIKDGGRKAAAVIVPVQDAFASIQTTYEDLWVQGSVQL